MKINNENMYWLKKLSKRNDFENIHNKYFYRDDVIILRKNMNEELKESTWKHIHNNKVVNVNGFYISLISNTSEVVRKILTNNNILVNVENVLNTVNNYMLETIAELSNRMLIAEMNKANTDEATYIKYLSNNYKGFERLTNKYPYWNSLIGYFIKESNTYLYEFLTRLLQDHEEVSKSFYGETSRIDNILLNKGDRHKGKFVIEVKTATGNYYYKPRSADVDEAFQKCLNKISQNDKILDMRMCEFINKGEYSWFKKVEYVPLKNQKEKDRYYRRMGQLIAVMYLLNGNDIHHENLISCGEHPIIIDVETLLTSRLLFMKTSISQYTQKKDNFYLFDSVRNSMMIPNVFKYKDENLDISPVQICGNKKILDINKNSNHKLLETEVSSLVKIICRGFEMVYTEVTNNKKEYEIFIKTNFKGKKLRFLNKPTDEYVSIKNMLYNPVCLYDSNFAFAITSRLFDKNKKDIPYEELIEQKDVLLLNIPYFEIKSDKRNLILDNGSEIKDYFVETPLDGIVNKLRTLCEKDLIRQKKIIQRSFEVLSSDFVVRELCDVRNTETYIRKSWNEMEINLFLEKSIHKVFKEGLINPFNNRMFWMDPMLHGDNETGEEIYQLCDIPNSYYGGNIGILITLLSINGENKYEKYINELIANIDDEVKNLVLHNKGDINIGTYSGLGAYLRYYLTLYRYGRITKKQLNDYSWPIIKQIENGYKSDNKLDILDGSAGVILTLIELHNNHLDNSNRILKLIKKLKEYIKRKIVYKEDNAYFPLENRVDTYFSGFAHGSCGIIMALNKANRLLGVNEQELMKKLLRTERKMYDPKRKIWSRDNHKLDYSWGWCHGIPGILLSRIELYNDGYVDERIGEEIRELYEISLKKSLGSNLTLCHGDLSNIVICQYAGEVLENDNNSIDEYLDELVPYILESVKLKIRGTEAVGLMNGLMGIVMFMENYIKRKDASEIKRVLLSI